VIGGTSARIAELTKCTQHIGKKNLNGNMAEDKIKMHVRGEQYKYVDGLSRFM
jgi:hypothetical protein